MSNALNKKQIEFLNRGTEGTWSYNPATGLVDVEGDFRFSNCIYEKPEDLKGVRFGKVRGSFDCSYNYLTSLAGAPQKVGRNFFCQGNKLTSLAGGPQEVGGDFNCSGGYSYKNYLTSLAGAPQKVGGNFNCGRFKLSKRGWNPKGWLRVLNRKGKPKAQKLILTLLFDPQNHLFTAKELNKEIQKDPARMIMILKEVWNDENFKETRSKIVLPKGYELEADLVGDLYGVGF